MHFVLLVNFKKKPTKESIANNLRVMELEEKEGVKYKDIYWTLGRYDAVVLCDAPNEKVMMKASIRHNEFLSIETLVGIPAEEARKLAE